MCLCKPIVLWTGILAVAALLMTPVFAQYDVTGDTIKSFEIDEVVVTANRHRFSVESAMSAQILTGRELEKLNALSIADAIRYFSGVQLKDYGGVGGIKTINVRSLGSAHTAVFYDGMSVGNAQNGQVDLGKYSLDNVEAIELYNGQKSSIFQPARGFVASNTLFLRTKIPQFVDGKNFYLKTTFKTGSFGLVNPALLYQQQLTQNLSLSVSAEYVRAHGRYPYRYRKDGGYDTTAVRQNGDITAFRTEWTLHARLKNSGIASLKAYVYDSERGLPGAIVANRFSHVQRQWDRNFFVHGSLQRSFFKKHDMLANLKFSRDYNRYIDPDYKTLEGALDNRYYQNELYVSIVNQAGIYEWWDISLATDFSVNTLDANLYRFVYPSRYSYLCALSNRMKWRRLDFQANLLYGYLDERVDNGRKADNRKLFCPVVSASVQPFSIKTLRIKAFYKESFRMPTFNDLYYTFIGNSFLRPEYAKQYDIGVTWVHDRNTGLLRSAAIQFDTYYNRVKDKIIALPSHNLFRWTMMNLGEVEIKGLETSANFSFQLPGKVLFDLGLNYTYQQAIDITPEGTTYGDQIPYTPVHSGTLTASVQRGSLQLNYSFIYTGERYSQKANIPVNYVQPWYTHDLALAWEWKAFKIPVRAGLEVNNLLNQYYDVILNFPMPGRNYRLNLSLNI
jgi:outer membrane cobalamin receptor